MKAISKKRIKEISKWYNETDYEIAICKVCSGQPLGTDDFIELLIILANSENIKKDFQKFMIGLGFLKD